MRRYTHRRMLLQVQRTAVRDGEAEPERQIILKELHRLCIGRRCKVPEVAVLVVADGKIIGIIDKERMPAVDQNELLARVEWNENIHVDENRDRVDRLLEHFAGKTVERTAAIGQQDYLLERDRPLSSSEAELYFKTEKPEEIAPLQKAVYAYVAEHYPYAVISFSPPETSAGRSMRTFVYPE